MPQTDMELQLYQTAFNHSMLGIMLTDKESRILLVNPCFTRTTGYEVEDVEGKRPCLLQSGRHGVDFYQGMWQAVHEKGYWQGEIWNRRKNGEVYLEWLSIRAIKDAQGKVVNYLGLFSDISSLFSHFGQMEDRLSFLAYHDFLTGLPNRLLFSHKVQQAVQKSARDGTCFGLLCVDLDRFYYFNETYGPHFGDQVLQFVGYSLRQRVEGLGMACCLHGNEFAILLEKVDEPWQVMQFAEGILTMLSKTCSISGKEVSIAASIGISLYPTDGEEGDELLKKAYAASRFAKEWGGNRCLLFNREQSLTASKRLQLTTDLNAAMKRDELQLYYQPQVELATGNLIGLEALLRWRHPRYGYVSPAEFIPIAEEMGGIVLIGEWVLRMAAEQHLAWQSMGLPKLRMAVNISAKQFQQPNFVQTVRQILEETGLEPQYLALEITESVSMHRVEEVVETLQELDRLGVKIAMDDFGTGYSSLSYLTRFSLHELKIDASFIRNIPSMPEARAVATTIITLAHSLKLKVIAEGVENEQQLAFLKSHHCDAMQGHLLSRPLPAEETEALLRRHASPTRLE